MARHAARRIALQMIYARMMNGGDARQVLEGEPDAQNVGGDEEYITEALRVTGERCAAFDETIRSLSPRRALERIPVLNRAILHLAMYELEAGNDAKGIVINEAVELAKRFGEESDSKFIHAVLGKAADAKNP
ncbi:MAG TPA: transcription antitermination factor NusB [Candidatus Limnocylindria bacterium]|nr:transcription antitermination factor NusB [Candidatus Limnocylindria bacterium]